MSNPEGDSPASEILLRLYIAGSSATSRRAESSLLDLQRAVGPKCRVEIVDVLASPELAERAGVLATPTLSYDNPDRPRRVIGDLSDAKRVLEFLGIEAKEKPHDL